MGGVTKTISKGMGSAKKVFSGKGNARDFFSMMTGMPSQDHGTPPPESEDFQATPEEIAYDQGLIKSLGKEQYDEMLGALGENQKSQESYAADMFKRTLPGTAEDYNAGGLLNSTGYQQEVARQQSNIASDLAAQSANAKLNALGVRQGFDTSALNRGFSLRDFAKQSRIAKAIGATNVPMAPSGKTGAIQGGAAGAGAGTSFGPWGALIGGVAGAALGSQQYKDPKKGGK